MQNGVAIARLVPEGHQPAARRRATALNQLREIHLELKAKGKTMSLSGILALRGEGRISRKQSGQAL